MKLVLVRHGVSEQNIGDMVSGGNSNPKLTGKGIKNIQKISQHIDENKVDLVYSSPLTRAYETARLLTPNKSIQVDNRLKEMDFGAWDGSHANELRKDYPDAFDFMGMFNNNYAKYAANSESYDDITRRTREFLKGLKQVGRHKTVLVVCHGVTIRGFLSAIFGLDTSEFTNVANVGFSEVIFDEKNNWNPRLISFNKTIPVIIRK